tara:strand:- start:393 stop:638 length:246 start_codon:yes stop_codon:yes gene_type:complete
MKTPEELTDAILKSLGKEESPERPLIKHTIEILFTEVDCTECDGTGSREHDISTYADISPQSEYRICEECNGHGEIEMEVD